MLSSWVGRYQNQSLLSLLFAGVGGPQSGEGFVQGHRTQEAAEAGEGVSSPDALFLPWLPRGQKEGVRGPQWAAAPSSLCAGGTCQAGLSL